MTMVRWITLALMTVAMLAAGAAKSASTTNFTDQWYKADESGWGAAVLQQWDTLFIDMFVYGADNKPTWFVAGAKYQPGAAAGHAVFTGDLYTGTGPYYGSPFDSAPVVGRKVGTLTFDATGIGAATLTYTVDGTRVEKPVTRQTWAYENLSGNYYGGWVFDLTSCASASDNGHIEAQITMQIIHNADNSVSIGIQDDEGNSFTLSGAYTQAGHMGQIVATFNPPGPPTGSITMIELERTISGGTGRFVGRVQSPASCNIANGRIAGVRR